MIDYYGGLTTKINPRLSVELTGHFFYLDKDFIYKDVKTNKNLGPEADCVVSYVVSPEIAIQGGCSIFLNSNSTAKYFNMQNVIVHPQQWVFMMLTVKPKLYKTPIVVENK